MCSRCRRWTSRLWDIAGKAAGLPLWRLFGATPVAQLTCYASLLRYGEAGMVAAACERAIARGYRDIKLHEITVPEVRAAAPGDRPGRQADGRHQLPWTVWQAIDMARRMRDLDLTWLEEPVSPPGDHAGLARVRREGGVPIAAGENAAGLHDFRAQFEAGAIDVAQPSVIKIGGPSAMLEIAALAKAFGVRVVPHNAYFGPGFLASLHVNATIAPDAPFERLFIDLEASPLPRSGGGEGRPGDRARRPGAWPRSGHGRCCGAISSPVQPYTGRIVHVSCPEALLQADRPRGVFAMRRQCHAAAEHRGNPVAAGQSGLHIIALRAADPAEPTEGRHLPSRCRHAGTGRCTGPCHREGQGCSDPAQGTRRSYGGGAA